MTTDQKIFEDVRKLNDDDKRLVAEFVKLLRKRRNNGPRTQPPPFSDRKYWENWAKGFTSKDLKEMADALQECERIDEDAWR